MSNTRAGSLGAFPLVGILAATVLIGPILDKAGAKPALALALLLIALALAVLSMLSSYVLLGTVALAYGVGGGILNTATNALVADLSATGRAAALNLLGFSFSIGAIVVPLMMSQVRGTFSTTTVLHILSIISAAILILVLVLRFPPPSRPGTSLKELLRVLRQPPVWLLGALLFFESGNENCVYVWAARVAKEVLHVAAARSALALLSVSVALAAGRLLAVLWLKWLGSRTLLLTSALVTVAGAASILREESFAGVVAGFAVVGLGMSAIYPTALGLAGDRFPFQTGTVFGAVMTVSLVGGTLGPLVGGWMAAANPERVLAVPIGVALRLPFSRCWSHRGSHAARPVSSRIGRLSRERNPFLTCPHNLIRSRHS